eukprot:Amastigsp_a531628_6.p2 type:complete len:110 gc:universal Amastigsp_a531628_6:230-559(+)
MRSEGERRTASKSAAPAAWPRLFSRRSSDSSVLDACTSVVSTSELSGPRRLNPSASTRTDRLTRRAAAIGASAADVKSQQLRQISASVACRSSAAARAAAPSMLIELPR